jgi:hypothetical protein
MNGILRCRLIGQVTDEVFKEFFRIGAQHAIRSHPKAGVVDLTEVISFEVSAQVIEKLARTTPVLPDPHLRRVVIAPSPEIYGMMRMFEMEGEATRPGIHVVHTEQEAWAILSVKKPRFYPLDTFSSAAEPHRTVDSEPGSSVNSILEQFSSGIAFLSGLMVSFPRCDIFSGDPGRDAQWIESTNGLANARKRMQELAKQRPGKYFIFYTGTQMVVASVQTLAKPDELPKSSTV